VMISRTCFPGFRLGSRSTKWLHNTTAAFFIRQ
jgi:hypothetical protein